MAVISTGIAAEWNIFAHQTDDGRAVIVRSRLAKPEVREFAEANFMARVRCVLGPNEVNQSGMPISTAELDEWEAKLLSELERVQARAYELAVVTGAGVRDFFFAAVEENELLNAIGNVEGTFGFQLQLARIDGPKDQLLNSLTQFA